MKIKTMTELTKRKVEMQYARIEAQKQMEMQRTGLEITAGQRTMAGLIVDLTGQTFVLPVMLTGQNSIVLKMK